MRAIYFDGSKVHYRGNETNPVPTDGEALIQVSLAGICQTDLEIVRKVGGYMHFQGIPGHEFVGKVVQCQDPRWVGKRVCGEINCVCGKCDMCLRGLAGHCRNRTVLGIYKRNGAFADLLTLPIRNLHEVPENLEDEQAVFTEPLAAACQILRQSPITKRDKVTVLGDGRLGQLCAQVLKTTQCKLTLVGRHTKKLAIADRLGIPTRLDVPAEIPKDQDIVIECTGRFGGLTRAMEYVRPRGMIILKTTIAPSEMPAGIDLSPLVVDEITVLGSRCGPFHEALRMMAQRQVDVSGMVSRRFSLQEAAAYLENPAAFPPDLMKLLISFGR